MSNIHDDLASPAERDGLLLHNQLCFALYSTSQAMTKAYKPFLSALNLTYPQYMTMLVLWERDGLSEGDISAQLLTDPGTVTPLLQRLETGGLVSRVRNPKDQRVTRLYLTQEGKALRENVKSIPHSVILACGGSLEYLQALRKDLFSLRSALQDNLDTFAAESLRTPA